MTTAAPILFPHSMDALLYQRRETIRLATYAVQQTRHHFRFAARLTNWQLRLNARIAQVTA